MNSQPNYLNWRVEIDLIWTCVKPIMCTETTSYTLGCQWLLGRYPKLGEECWLTYHKAWLRRFQLPRVVFITSTVNETLSRKVYKKGRNEKQIHWPNSYDPLTSYGSISGEFSLLNSIKQHIKHKIEFKSTNRIVLNWNFG